LRKQAFRWDFDAQSASQSMVCNQIPYATEQGIFKRVSGKIFKEQGIFVPDASILNFKQPQPTFAGTAPAKRP
jgi:hypothetical protein